MAFDMNGASSPSLSRVAGAVRGCRTNMETAARWMHPSWTAALLGIEQALVDRWQQAVESASAEALAGASFALCESAGAQAPCIAQLSERVLTARPEGTLLNPDLLDACPVPVGLQILRMRALSFRRGEVRRLIDKRTRTMLSAWVGVSVDKVCLDTHLPEAPNIATLHAQIDTPLLASLDENALAIEGLALIRRDCGATASASCPLLCCALPHRMTMPPWIARLSLEVDALGTARLFARLSTLLPEWAWLFG